MYYSEHTRHNQSHTVSVVVDPDGGEHPCQDITDERYDVTPRYWCAGYTGHSPGDLADRLWSAWDRPDEPTSDFDELRAMEAMIP